MADRDLPTPDYLRQRLRYEPETGKLYWRECVAAQTRWNSRWAGKEAGSISRYGYRVVFLDGAVFRAHRIAWAMVQGAWPNQKQDIDHIDHDRTNNRIENLRAVGRETNCRNASLSQRNTSGHAGVVWCRRTRKWQAQIAPNRRCIHLGRFVSFDDAVAARKAAEARYGFHANHGVEARMKSPKDRS